MNFSNYDQTTQYRLLCLLFAAILLTLLTACSDPNSNVEAELNTAVIDITVERDLLTNVDSCFFANGSLNAWAYVYDGVAVLPGDLGGVGPEPILRSPLTEKADLNYTFNVTFTVSGTYSIAIVCDVAIDQPSRNDALTYLKHETYYISIKNTVGLINNFNKVDHLIHDDTPPGGIGIVCVNCHSEATAKNYLVTTIDHNVVNPDCMACHTATGIATAATNHLSTISLSRPCTDCHVDFMWLREKQDHNLILNGCDTNVPQSCGCDASNCHAFEKLPSTAHNATNDDCVNCHSVTAWLPPTI